MNAHQHKRHTVRRTVETIFLAFLLLWAFSTWQAANANASVAHNAARTQFCNAFATFGDSPTFHNLTTVHDDATHVAPRLRGKYEAYEHALLQGRPRTTLRNDLDAVYKACGDRSA